ncbi:MAG: three-Cys-motif partner protein TcmP [Bacteroidetes bacterium]|nr:three-Cys-motif partner protein TcmP [Bacteroidota bacterium]
MAKKNVKTNVLDHSKAKIKLLNEYLKRYLNIITNDGYTERIKIFDLFCGEGIYEDGNEGSPLVIMRVVKDLHFINASKNNRIPPIDCHFNDLDASKVEKVKNIINEKSLHHFSYGKLDFSSNDYSDKIQQLSQELPKLRNQKAFIFIDPYGYKHIKASDFKILLSQDNVELLLFLPTQFMYRFDSNGTPESLKDFVEEMVDYKSWKDPNNVWEYVDQLKNAFRKYLGNKYFVDTFTIQKDPQTVFCLFFFCSHIRGFEKMLEAKWKIDVEQGKGWKYISNQDSLFLDQKTNPLEEKLMEFIKTGDRGNGDIYEFTLRCGFLPTHAVDVFDSLQKNAKLNVLDSNEEKARKGSFYISYKHYKNEKNKVKFKLI